MPRYTLFVKPTCPFCNAVLAELSGLGLTEGVDIEIKLHNGNKQELIRLGGHDAVPYLFDRQTHKGMYDSKDIINYLKLQNEA